MAGRAKNDSRPGLFRRIGMKPVDMPLWVLGLMAAFVWAVPFFFMVSNSFKPPAETMTQTISWLPQNPTLQNYVYIFERFPILRWAWNSFFVAVVATTLNVLFGAMAGYALTRIRFRGRGLMFKIFLASLMVPSEIMVIPLLLAMIKIGWVNSYQALILPMLAHVFSLYIFRQFYLNFPSELDEAGRMDGAGHFRFFWSVALPMARAPLLAAVVITFNLNWNNFLWPLLVVFEEGMKTMPVGIAEFAPSLGSHTQVEGFGPGMAGITLLSLPSLLLFFLFQRYFIEGLNTGGVKG